MEHNDTNFTRCSCRFPDSPCYSCLSQARWVSFKQHMERAFKILEELEEAVDDCTEEVAEYRQNAEARRLHDDQLVENIPAIRTRRKKKRPRQSQKGDDIISDKQVIEVSSRPAPAPTASTTQGTINEPTTMGQKLFNFNQEDFPPL